MQDVGTEARTATRLQCPVCGRRHELLPRGRGERPCACGWQAPMALDAEPVTLVPLPPPSCAALVIRPLPAGARVAGPGRALREPLHAAPEPAIALSPPITPRDRDPILAALAAGRLASLDDVRLRLMAERLALESGFAVLRSLPLVRGIRLHDYQQRTVRHVLKELGGRALLADEVGLGKTIEAGCALAELHVRGLVKRVLVLTPASLVTQWREELVQRFRLRLQMARRPEDWRRHDLVIGSLDTAKTDRHAEAIHAARWDLVIVDEAHRLKNKRTRNWQFVNSLRSRFLLLLSATPFQNDLLELFNLVTVLRPGQLHTEQEFKQKFLARGDPRRCRDPVALRGLLAQVMVRNRRGDVGVEFAPRRSVTHRLPMPDEQRGLYDAAIAFCRQWFPTLYGHSAPLATVGYLKMLCASAQRFGESLEHAVQPRARELGDPELLAHLATLIDLAQAVPVDVKLEALARHLAEHDEKVVLFTQYRGTLKHLAARLAAEGVTHVGFHGGMDAREKDEAVERFRGPARVLLATDAGSEGRNLQFARRVINYDLPWNPMKIEQRIGRVHRLGQTREVLVASFTLAGTLEDQLLAVLEQKLNVFQLVVGEIEMILGKLHVEQQIARMFLHSRHDVEFRRRLARFGEELSALRHEYGRQQAANQAVL